MFSVSLRISSMDLGKKKEIRLIVIVTASDVPGHRVGYTAYIGVCCDLFA